MFQYVEDPFFRLQTWVLQIKVSETKTDDPVAISALIQEERDGFKYVT